MTTKLIVGSLAGALLAATAAGAAERLPFGPPSEPTIFGHKVEKPRAAVEIDNIDLRREVETAAPRGFVPSEPTIWGHRPETRR